MAAHRATHTRPIWRRNQGFPRCPEPGLQPSLPPRAHHHHWLPKRRPHEQRPHWPTPANDISVRNVSPRWDSPGRRVRPAAGRPAGPGGGGWAARERPPLRAGRGAGGRGGRSASARPSALPWAGYNAGVIGDAQVMGGAAPILLVFLVARRPRAWSVRRPCALVRVRPPVATPAGAGGGGRGGARRAGPAASPPGRRGPVWGRGDVPSASGGWRAGAPVARRSGGNLGGEGGGGAPLFPTPLSWGGGPWPPSLSPWAPPLGIHVQPGLPASHGRRVRPGRPPWVTVARGGGGFSLPRSAPQPSPGGHQGGPLRLRTPRCRCSVAAHGAGAELPVSSGQCGSEWAVDSGRLARGCARRGCGVPPLGATALSGGCGAAASPAGLRPPTSRRGGGVGGRGGSPESPPGPLEPPPDRRGGAAWWFWSRGASIRLGGRTLPAPAPLHPSGTRPSCRPSLGPSAFLAVAARCRLAGGREEGDGQRVLGAAARGSGQRLAGCGAVGLPSRSLPPSSPPLEVARAPPPRGTSGGVWVGGPGSAGGGAPRHCPLPTPSRSSPGPAGRGRHLRPRLCGGWSCGGGGFLPAVAPVGEGVAQSPGEPVVGICVCDTEDRPPLQEGQPVRFPVGPRRPNHRPEDPLVVLWGRPAPQRHLPVPPVPPEEHGIEGLVPHPPGGPRAGAAQPPVHLNHQGEGLGPQGIWDCVPVPVPGPGPLYPPRRLPLRPLFCTVCPRVTPEHWGEAPVPAAPAPRPAPPPPRERPSAPAPPSAPGGLAGAGVGRG